jgi:MFS family permease
MRSETRPPPGRRERARDDRGHVLLAKSVRAVAYGALSAFLLLYLHDDLGLSLLWSLVLTSLTLIGAAGWSLLTVAPLEARFGRRRTLSIFGGLFTASAILLFVATSPWLVLFAVLLGGVGASSADNGPLAAIDQALLPSTLRSAERGRGFAWYNVIGNFGSAGGALLVAVPGALDPRSVPYLPNAPHPWIGLLYIALAAVTWWAYQGISPDVEPTGGEGRAAAGTAPLSPETRGHTRALAVLFGLDAFAGGMVINPVLVAYFVLVWHQSAGTTGELLFVVGTVSGVSFLAASSLAERFGLLPTMVFTHLPSNVMLALVPLMPTFPLAFGMLVARSGLSQMDVPTRQAYTMSLASRRERAAVASTLAGSRGAAQCVGPLPSTALQSAGLFGAPFLIAGSLKVVYDLAVWRRFRRVATPEDDDDG